MSRTTRGAGDNWRVYAVRKDHSRRLEGSYRQYIPASVRYDQLDRAFLAGELDKDVIGVVLVELPAERPVEFVGDVRTAEQHAAAERARVDRLEGRTHPFDFSSPNEPE